MIDLAFKNTKSPEIGKILISDPFLDEDYFRRSVILLCDHNEDGTFGFVLNNYLELGMHEIDEDFPNVHSKISVGGPVDTESIFFIHAFGDAIEGSYEIKKGIYFGGNYDQLAELIRQNPQNNKLVRFFLGYSGWGKNQLTEELKKNSWIVADNISVNDILDTNNPQFWNYCMEKQGGKFKTISKFPINPNNN